MNRMNERVNVPSLGPGWTMMVKERGIKTHKAFDVYYWSPENVQIRSKVGLEEHLGQNLTHFDFRNGVFTNKRNLFQFHKLFLFLAGVFVC